MNWLSLFIYGIFTQNRVYEEISKYLKSSFKSTVGYLEEKIRILWLRVSVKCTSVKGYKIWKLINIWKFLGAHKKHML